MKKLKKAPYLSVGFQNKIFYLGFGSIQKKIENKKLGLTLLKIFKEFTTPKSWDDIELRFSPLPFFQQAKSIIQEGNYLIEEDIYDKEDRFSRSKLFYSMQGVNPLKAQRKLSNSKVGIIGCGGIGNLISVNLATAGVKNFYLIDEDLIESSNLSRQIMFTENNLGKSKAKTLKNALEERANYVEIEILEQKIKNLKDLTVCKELDLLVVSADKGGVVEIVNKFSIENNIPYINVGYVNDIAVWGPFVIPKETGCYCCQNIIANESTDDDIEALVKEVNKDYQAPSTGAVNMLSSSLATLDIIKYLVGEVDIASKNKRIGLWSHNLKFETQNCSKNPICKVCS